MRQVTHGEKERIRKQTLTRLSGKCDIAFGLSYFAYYDPGTDDLDTEAVYGNQDRWMYWWEDGYVGEISFEGTGTWTQEKQDRNEEELMSSDRPVLGHNIVKDVNYINPVSGEITTPDLGIENLVIEGQVGGMFTVGRALAYAKVRNYAGTIDWKAKLTLPAEYEKGFLTTQGTNAKGRRFKFEKSPPGVATHDTIYCNSIVIRTVDGQPLPYNQPNVYSIVGDPRPNRSLDGLVYELEAQSNWGFWTTSGYLWPDFSLIGSGSGQSRKPMIAGAGVIDAAGYYSRRRDHAFRYMTTGDLRLYKLWPEVT